MEEARITEIQSPPDVAFNKGDKEVGRLEFQEEGMVFKGKVEESAQVFFDWLLDNLINPYLEERLKKE